MSAPQVKKYGAGQALFNEGDTPKAIYIVQKGTVAIRKRKQGGHIEIAKIHTKEVIGELGFFDRKPRSASAICVGDVEVLEISFVSLEKVYDAIPSYLKTIFACVTERLRKANDTIRRLEKDVVTLDSEPTSSDSPSEKSKDEDLLAAINGENSDDSDPESKAS